MADPKPSAHLVTGQVYDALVKHYRKPGTPRDGEVLIPEPQAPGTQRRCDLVRISMWLSRGTGIDAHEIKVTRSDWLRELDDPAKAEAWWPYCTRWWLVTPPGLVHDGELPAGWGLMELPKSGRRFKVRVQAAAKDPTITTALLVELLRRADNARLAELDTLRSKHADDLRAAVDKIRAEQDRTTLDRQTSDRLRLLEQLEAAIGMRLDHYGWDDQKLPKVEPGELAAALADVRDHVTITRRREETDRYLRELRRAASSLLARLQDLPPNPLN